MESKISETAKTIHALTNITTRHYKNRQLIECHSSFVFPEPLQDLFRLYWEKLSRINTPIGCVTTSHKLCFGFVRYSDEYLVIGPVMETPRSFSEIRTIADHLDPEFRCHDILIKALRSCPTMSVYSFMPILAGTLRLLNFSEGADAGRFDDALLTSIVDITFLDPGTDGGTARYQSMEYFFEDIIERGDVRAIQQWFLRNPLFHFRISITGNSLKDVRDCFILCSTLYAKAATRGGLDRNHTLRLQLNAIRAMEELDNESDILQLQSDLAIEFTREVAAFNSNPAGTKLVRDAMRIIQASLYSSIRVDDIAAGLSVSRGHLSKVFRSEVGQTISGFITQKKIEEAKRLLLSTSRSLASISDLLKFSSQSHFTKVFKTSTGMTPKQFRDAGRLQDGEQ